MRSGPELLLLPLSQRVQIKALRLSWRKRGAPPSQSGPVSLVPPCPSGWEDLVEQLEEQTQQEVAVGVVEGRAVGVVEGRAALGPDSHSLLALQLSLLHRELYQ
ncbi:hypothetical protein GN956_G10710 [Arapaima gigas]